MSRAAWLVWTGRQVAGVFRDLGTAVGHCKQIANDHRRKGDMLELSPECYRYCGPRGKRHGTSRLVAFIGTPRALDEIGIDVKRVLGPASEALQ